MDYLIPPERYDTLNFTIRAFGEDDGPRMLAAVTRSYAHLRPWMPWARRDMDAASAERYVRSTRARWLLAEDFTLAIVAPDNSELLGGCGYHLRSGPLADRAAEIGMWIAGPRAGKGLGTAVLRHLLAWGFSAWPWRRLAWRCNAANHASRRVAENAGMRLEGVLAADQLDGDEPRDTACYALLREKFVVHEAVSLSQGQGSPQGPGLSTAMSRAVESLESTVDLRVRQAIEDIFVQRKREEADDADPPPKTDSP